MIFAEAEVAAVARIKQAADNGTWQAASWLLERKHGERWGRNDKLRQEITGANGAPVALSIEEAKKAVLAFLDEGVEEDEFINTVNSAQDEYGAEAKYELGDIFYQTKDYKQCYATLVSLNTDFASYTDWVGKSYLLLADNYLAQGDSFNAKTALNSLISSFPQENVKTQAREKLNKIEAAEIKRTQSLKADTLDNEK